jgi:hypothetical protein
MTKTERIQTLFGTLRTCRFVVIDDADPRGPGDAVRGHDGHEYRVVERHRFFEDHMLGDVLSSQTRSVALFLERVT